MTIRMWRPSLVSLLIISTLINQKLRSDFTGKSPTFHLQEFHRQFFVCFILSGHVALDFLSITELRKCKVIAITNFYCNLSGDTHLTNHNKVARNYPIRTQHEAKTCKLSTASVPSVEKRTVAAKRGKTYGVCQARENVRLLPRAGKLPTPAKRGKTSDCYQAREKCVPD